MENTGKDTIIEAEQNQTEEVNWSQFDVEDENIESDNPGGVGVAGEKEWRLKRFLDVFGSLFALNICFVLTSLPIVTIGASFTALYAMMFKVQKRDDYTVVKEYFKEFKQNWKKGTIAWLIMVLAAVIMWGQYTYICNFQGGLVSFYQILLLIEGVVFLVGVPFVFPLLAYFDNTLVNTFKNSFLLAISNLGSWLKIFVLWVVVLGASYKYPVLFLNTWYLWLLLLIALLTYISSIVAKNVFDRVKKKQVEEKKDDKSITLEEANRRKKQEQKERKKSIKERMAVMDVVNGVKSKDKE